MIPTERAFRALYVTPDQTVPALAQQLRLTPDTVYMALKGLVSRRLIVATGCGREKRTFRVTAGVDAAAVKFGSGAVPGVTPILTQRLFMAIHEKPDQTLAGLARRLHETTERTYATIKCLLMRRLIVGVGYGSKTRRYQVAPEIIVDEVRFGPTPKTGPRPKEPRGALLQDRPAVQRLTGLAPPIPSLAQMFGVAA